MNIELVSSLGHLMEPAIPVIPTTNQEAQEGWDALFKLGSGFWYFLQYKVSNYASKRSTWNEAFWDVHGQPYYRFPFHVDSRGECSQHRLLTELRLTQKGVYYCTPAFVKEEELWDRVRSGSVMAGSRLFDVEDLVLPDYHGAHQVSFDDSGLTQVWSERGRQSKGDRFPAIRRTEENRRPIDRESVGSLLRDATRVAVSARRSRSPQSLEAWADARFPDRAQRLPLDEDAEYADRLDAPDLIATTSRILQLDFGLTWVIEPSAV